MQVWQDCSNETLSQNSKIYRIRRKSHFQRPQKYTYLGAFGVKLKIKFSKKKKTILTHFTVIASIKTNFLATKVKRHRPSTIIISLPKDGR